MSSLLIRNCEVPGVPDVDVLIRNGVITQVGKGLDREDAAVLDAGGGAVIPGLHDHHIHLRALAAEGASVRVGPPHVTDAEQFRSALRGATGNWVRAVGYHESVAGDIDAAALDVVVADRPVRVQHRSGAMWVLNREGLRQAGVDDCGDPGVERAADGRPTGRLMRMDGWLREHTPPVALDLTAVGVAAAARGVTGFTDTDPDRSRDDAAGLVGFPQRLHVMGPVGMQLSTRDRMTMGPVKVLLHDDDLPAPDALAATAVAAHAEDRGIAVHCVTRAQLVITLAGLAEAGPAKMDRIEHAAVVPDDLVGDLVRTGATVVTQPAFVAERGDAYRTDVDPDDLAVLYRLRSLIDAGVPVAAGTDAPFGDADPWASVRAAVDRTTPSDEVLGPDERIPTARALALFLGHRDDPATLRTVRPGADADLCVLRCPLTALDHPTADVVRATIVAGDVIYDAGP